VKSQTAYLEEIEESFAPLPIFRAQHMGQEVFGLELLDKIGDSLYQKEDPAKIFHRENPFEVRENDQEYMITIHLPFIGNQDFKLDKFGDELVININNRRKSVFLPRFANFLVLSRYNYKENHLTIHLQKN
jgi:arsenite-transporting ATPase